MKFQKPRKRFIVALVSAILLCVIVSNDYSRNLIIWGISDVFSEIAESKLFVKMSIKYVEVTVDKDELQECYDYYMELFDTLNSKDEWSYEDMDKIYSGVNTLFYHNGSPYYFKGMKGKIDSVEKIKETDQYILIKIVFDMENPALTALKKGKNDKYMCITKISEELDSPGGKVLDSTYYGVYVEDPDNIKLKYYEGDDDELGVYGTHLEWPPYENLGFGYKNDEVRYSNYLKKGEKIMTDLNNDGEKDSLTFKTKGISGDRYKKMYVNKGKKNEAVYEFEEGIGYDYKYSEVNKIIDIDKTDNYKEIIVDKGLM
ncbi:MAG: hypothetical protein K6G26_11825, partial [Lachnospiraceae bacterium]|nr:hypothetical protein [Lachnospiraceae bacterium]